MKLLKPFSLFVGIVISLVCLFVLALGVYFAGQLSSTYPHLKNYEYSVTCKQLEKKIVRVVKSDSCLSYKITDSTGTKNDRSYYMDVMFKSNNCSYLFNITYNNADKLWRPYSSCNIGLVGVFDKTNNYGGYLNDEGKLNKLIAVFDNSFISKLKMDRVVK